MQVDVRNYKLKHLIEGREPTHPDSWEDRGHTLTVITPSSNDNDARDELFLNHRHIHPKNWQWIHKPLELAFSQGSGESYVGGHIGFSPDCLEGSGAIQVRNAKIQSVRASYMRPTYTCDVSSNAGAYVVKEGLTLKWNTTSKEWNDAKWDEGALKFTYWVEKDGKVGNQQLYQTATIFEEVASKTTWDVQPRGPGGSGAATTSLSPTFQFEFVVNTGYSPPTSEYFPYKMVFQFDQLAKEIEGGAMLCDKLDPKLGKVFAIKGQVDNTFAVGSYKLYSEQAKPTTLTTHGRKLVVNDKPVTMSWMSGDQLHWKHLNVLESQSDLPSTGFVTFSPDGTRVISSSHGWKGHREFADSAPPSTLNLMTLLNMNPFGRDKDGNTVEFVQQTSMEGFYKIIQYYMPADLLHNFIAAQPPDLGDIQAIAVDNSANKAFYANLAVPYLTNALKSAKRDSVRKLNARRAQKILKEATSTEVVYKDQSARLYKHEWVKKFPAMMDFLRDQLNNTSEQHAAINQEADKWVASIKQGMEHVDEDEKQQLQQMINIAEDARSHGLNGKYWAFMFFRYLCSDSYLTALRMQMMDGNTSQAVTQNIQRYSSILSVLDDSTYFMKQFVQVMQVQQLTALLPSFMDIENNFQEITFFMEVLMREFTKKYVNSPDPAIQKRVQEVLAALEKNTIQEYMGVLQNVISVSRDWASISKNFKSAALKKFGTIATGIIDTMIAGLAAYAIVQVCTGMVKWSDLSLSEQIGFVQKCFLLVSTLIRKGIEAAVTYEATGTLWEAFKVFLGKDMQVYQDSISSALGKWVTNNSSRLAPDEFGLRALFHEGPKFEEEYPKVTKYLGKSLDEFMATRFAAAMAIVGIIINAFGIHEATSPLDKAMNWMFLLSSILDIVAAAANWIIAAGIKAGASAISTIASLAGPLAIFAAIVGIVLMLVQMFTTKKPPNPIDQFVNRDDVKSCGLYMQYETSIDYFQLVSDKDTSQIRNVGVTFSPKDSQLCLTVGPDGSLSLGNGSYSFSTVLSLDVDYQGYSYILTEIVKKKGDTEYTRSVVGLTLNDNNTVCMGKALTSDKQNAQIWVAICTGDVIYDDPNEKSHVVSASFTVENLGRKGTYLTVSNGQITTSAQATPWTLTMTGMKPDYLIFRDINLFVSDKDRSFSPYLLQTGSLSNRTWSVPNLPSFLTINDKTGQISQKTALAPPEFSKKTFTITVKNDFGSVSADFSIQVISI